MRILAVHNIKGGVGKTAAAVNLAYLASEAGARTLVWDLDPQGAATFYFRVKPKRRAGAKRLLEGRRDLRAMIRGTDFPDLDLLRAHFSFRNLDLALSRTRRPARRLARLVAPLADDYDLLFFDCPPGISLTSESVFGAADLLLVPTIPTTLSMRTLVQLIDHVKREAPRRLEVLPFFSMVDRRKALHRAIRDQGGASDIPFARTAIPYASEVERMGVHRAPLPSYARGSPAARAFRALWQEVEAAVSGAAPESERR